ncbi:hypothetical protein OH687_31210 [Burkholderia anthina]|nr:hypothetical protein OH687_31210 [Burkholderia anthina]
MTSSNRNGISASAPVVARRRPAVRRDGPCLHARDGFAVRLRCRDFAVFQIACATSDEK